VKRLVLEMMQRMGITQEQIDEMAQRIMEELRKAQEGGDDDTPGPESLPPSPN
jgi:hypothetical protein